LFAIVYGGLQWLKWWRWLGGLRWLQPLLFLSLCFPLFFFLCSFSLQTILPSFLSVLSPLPFLSSLFVLPPSIFIGKTEEREVEVTTVQPPHKTTQEVHPLFLVVSEKEGTGKARKKSLFLPLPGASREEERLQCRSKRHRLGLFPCFFYEHCMKQHRFGQNALFHLKGNDSKIVSKSKSVLNL